MKKKENVRYKYFECVTPKERLRFALIFTMWSLFFFTATAWGDDTANVADGDSPREMSSEENQPQPIEATPSEEPIGPPEWILSLSPSGGWLKNKVDITYTRPKAGGLEYIQEHLTRTDDGWGAGFVAMLYYKWFVWTNVLYLFPKVNDSVMFGGVSHFAATIPTPIFVKPYLGAGFFFMTVNSELGDVVEKEDGQMSDGTLTQGIATLGDMKVKNRILTPMPEIGVRFDLPIQHWRITPYYSLWYDNVLTKVSSTGGEVNIYKRDETEFIEENQIVEPYIVKPFDKEIRKEEASQISHILGAWICIDYNYFLQLQANLYYNVSHNLFSTRLIGTALLSKYVGIMAYFEYQELATVKNIYVFVGPVFTFMPPGYIDRVMAKRPKR